MMASSRLRTLVGGSARIGLGGEGILRTEGRTAEAFDLLSAAYKAGIRYYDSAPAYAGSEQYLGTFWSEFPDRVSDTFQTSKSAEREAKGAALDLERTLHRLHRDRLGLWQIHDVRTKSDLRALELPGGALRTFYAARENGTARGIGITGHHDPGILLHAVTSWDIDAVLLPVNPVEAAIGGFIDRVIPAARERGIGVIGMKVLGAGNFIFPDAGILPETLFRFALSQDVDIIIAGCTTPDEARALAQAGTLPAMDQEEQDSLVETIRPYANRLAFYRGVI